MAFEQGVTVGYKTIPSHSHSQEWPLVGGTNAHGGSFREALCGKPAPVVRPSREVPLKAGRVGLTGREGKPGNEKGGEGL